MSTLTIKDLTTAEDLDHEAMTTIHGGKTLNEAIGDTVNMLHDIGSGKCQFSDSGKSYVCF
jgi:hypothetical protein